MGDFDARNADVERQLIDIAGPKFIAVTGKATPILSDADGVISVLLWITDSFNSPDQAQQAAFAFIDNQERKQAEGRQAI